MNSLFLVVGLCVLVDARAEPASCPRFEYDRRLMEKIVRLEELNNECSERIHILEDALKSLKQEFIQMSSGIYQGINEVVSSSTQSAVKRLGVEFDDWQLVFRATSGNGFNVYNAWTEGKGVTATKPTSMKRSNDKHYLDLNMAKEWDEGKPISKVRYSLFHDELEVAFIVFDARDSNRHSWFDAALVNETSWPALFLSWKFNYFSSIGHPEVKRRFFINHNYGGCPKDKGYTAIVDTGVATQNTCQWDVQPSFPQILYSRINGASIWERLTFGRADYAAVYVK